MNQSTTVDEVQQKVLSEPERILLQKIDDPSLQRICNDLALSLGRVPTLEELKDKFDEIWQKLEQEVVTSAREIYFEGMTRLTNIAFEVKKSCKECGSSFVIEKREADWYAMKGYSLPSRCLKCRQHRQDIRKNPRTASNNKINDTKQGE